jgi:L-rhamnose isomerase
MRQARHMAESVARFRTEVEPVLREIRQDTERATERLERIRPEPGTQE